MAKSRFTFAGDTSFIVFGPESSRRPLGLPGRRQQVHFRLAIALGVLGHSRSFP